LAGLVLGILAQVRPDNFAFLFAYAVFAFFVIFRRNLLRSLQFAVILTTFTLISYLPFNLLIPSTMVEPRPSIGMTLYNTLSEWPATYYGDRICRDTFKDAYSIQRQIYYMQSGDRTYGLIRAVFIWFMFNDPDLEIYLKEVILDKPIL